MSMSNTNKRVKEIRRKTRRKFSSEEKIRIMLDGLRGEFMQSTIKRGHYRITKRGTRPQRRLPLGRRTAGRSWRRNYRFRSALPSAQHC